MATVTEETDSSSGDAEPNPVPPRRRRLRLTAPGDGGRRLSYPAALATAIAAGVCLLLAFPPYGLWPAAPVGAALLGAACWRRRTRGGFGHGFVAGTVCFLPLLSWTSLQVGEVPWILLALLQAVYFGLLGAASAYVTPFVARRPNLLPFVVAALWVGQEALRSRTPWGGFPWGRLVFSQADSPLGRLAWLGGASLATFGTALAGGLLLLAAWRIAGSPRTETTWRPIAAPAAAALAVVFVGYAVPTSTTAPAGEQITIAVVQGNVPRMGLDFNEQRRAVLDNHVSATIELAADVDAGRRPQPDVVVWPENASDIDPQLNPDAADEIDSAARAIGVPIVLGTILHDDAAVDGPRAKNASLVWDPETGSGFEYVKQHPVPFAEYIPMEQFVRTVAGWIDERIVKDGLDRVNGFAPGDEPGVIPVGDVTLSGIICFEIAYDGQVRESVTEGAQILAVQTNNATFNEAEALQQMAMVQIRSIEHARPGLMASTVGVSGFVDETGEVSQATGFNEPAVIVSTFNLGEGTTPATTLGALPELLGSAAAVAVLVLAATRRRRRKSADAKG